MKKIVTVAAIALLGTIVLPSCKKDYTCTCTDNSGNQIGTTNSFKATKKDAKKSCDELSTALQGAGSCKLD
jgi:hypothetical protein